MTDVSNVPQEPRDEPCPWPEVVDGACRNHILHPDEFGCDRCAHSKPPADIPVAPKRGAKVADWIDWAVRVGADPEYARSRSRDELIDEFGSRLPAPPVNPPATGTEPEVTVLEGADA